jgi:hypothetical protein
LKLAGLKLAGWLLALKLAQEANGLKSADLKLAQE